MTTKATLYIDDKLYKAYKIKAAHTGAKVSELVADAMRAQLYEDLEDIAALEESKNEPSVPFEQAVKELGFSLDDIQGSAQKERAKTASKTSS